MWILLTVTLAAATLHVGNGQFWDPRGGKPKMVKAETAVHEIEMQLQKTGSKLNDPQGLRVRSTTRNSDGSTVTRFSQTYNDIDVYNGDIIRRLRKRRTVQVVDPCTGKESEELIQGTITYTGWYVLNLTVNHKKLERLHVGENQAEVDRIASEKCSLKPANWTKKVIFITDDGHVEPGYYYHVPNRACKSIYTIDMKVLKDWRHWSYRPPTQILALQEAVEIDAADYIEEESLQRSMSPSDTKRTVEVIGDDQFDSTTGKTYRFVRLTNMGRDHKQRLSGDEKVPEMLAKWQKLKVEVRNDKCYLRNNHITVLRTNDENYILNDTSPKWIFETASFKCSRKRILPLNIKKSETAEYDLLANAMFVIDFVKQRYGDEFLDKTRTPIKLNYYPHHLTSVGFRSWTYSAVFTIGNRNSYPVTFEDVVTHELGHAFLLRAGLDNHFDVETGGMEESFGDMTGATMVNQMNPNIERSWAVGDRLPIKPYNTTGGNCKAPFFPTRYFDQPRRACRGAIDHVKDLPPRHINPENEHRFAGIFNKAFYVAVTSMEKLNACEAMLQVYDAFYVAFRDKFTMLTLFDNGAAAVLNSAEELILGDHTARIYHQKLAQVLRSAFQQVGISCNKFEKTWMCDFDRKAAK